jgi:small subunit ribosomal protein S9
MTKGFGNTITATGRRKTAVARIFLKPEKGDFTVNGKDIDTVYVHEKDRQKWAKPFHLVGVSHAKSKFSASIKVEGSGNSSQLSAIVHAISKALSTYSDEFKKILTKQGFLTRDPRMVERKKYFLHKARKAPQYSKR